ncbi:hypothetical protein DPEC_G00103270 [Dallia pectoralis]|uniref:Uncharacterized protein n=1 Tax=Dallia pectoralis TaxID=75939 RepID=A0ACC2GY79_DALPE|nr:hypothetical protein DPEC_G00103270 [Dallia pectoralis]
MKPVLPFPPAPDKLLPLQLEQVLSLVVRLDDCYLYRPSHRVADVIASPGPPMRGMMPIGNSAGLSDSALCVAVLLVSSAYTACTGYPHCCSSERPRASGGRKHN